MCDCCKKYMECSGLWLPAGVGDASECWTPGIPTENRWAQWLAAQWLAAQWVQGNLVG